MEFTLFPLEAWRKLQIQKIVALAAKEKLEIVKERGEAAQILGGFSSPPQAAKCVRTNSRIQHQTVGSAAEFRTVSSMAEHLVYIQKARGPNPLPSIGVIGIPRIIPKGFVRGSNPVPPIIK